MSEPIGYCPLTREELVARCESLEKERDRLRDLSVWGTTIPVGPTYDRLVALEARNEALRATLRNISTVHPKELFPAVTAVGYCRQKAIEALATDEKPR